MMMVYVTYASREEAERISRSLVEERLAACANVMAGHTSFYWWDGQVQDAQEVAVLYKTPPERFAALKAAVLKAHSYECPCIVGWPLPEGHAPFLEWIQRETEIKVK